MEYLLNSFPTKETEKTFCRSFERDGPDYKTKNPLYSVRQSEMRRCFGITPQRFVHTTGPHQSNADMEINFQNPKSFERPRFISFILIGEGRKSANLLRRSYFYPRQKNKRLKNHISREAAYIMYICNLLYIISYRYLLKWLNSKIDTYTYTHKQIFIYIYTYVITINRQDRSVAHNKLDNCRLSLKIFIQHLKCSRRRCV